ncbi:hypothetical protein ACTHO0_24750 [Cytobacillus praedii]|uniref:hypothetical protein n=1 Tax=Cytobacillus praedii TaxID=1742358 RepID=UPI003F7EFC75
MDQQLYTKLVQSWAEHLSGEHNVKFEKLLQLSKSNRRLRNLCGFYALSSEETFTTFTRMSSQDSSLGNLRFNLAKALTRLELESDTKISNTAKRFKAKYFSHMNPLVHESEYDVSAEMAKLYMTMVSSYSLANKEQSEEFQQKATNTMSKFNLSVLH